MNDGKERIRIREVMELVGMSRYQINQAMLRGEFPQCWRLTPRTRVWDRQEIIAWYETTRTVPLGDLVRKKGQVARELSEIEASRDEAAAELDKSVRALALSERMREDPDYTPFRKHAPGPGMDEHTPFSGRDVEDRKRKKAAASAAAAGDSSSDDDGAEADAGQDNLAGDDAANSALASVPAGHVTDEQMRQMFEEFERRTGGSRPSVFSDSSSGDDASAGSDDG